MRLTACFTIESSTENIRLPELREGDVSAIPPPPPYFAMFLLILRKCDVIISFVDLEFLPNCRKFKSLLFYAYSR